MSTQTKTPYTHPSSTTPKQHWRRLISFALLIVVALFSVTQQAKAEWLAAWQETSPLLHARAGAAIVKQGQHLYVIGGVDGQRFLNTVEVSEIQADGHLSPWVATAPMQDARGFFSATEYNGLIYAVGGGNGDYGSNLLRSVEVSRILPNGQLSPWKKLASNLNYPRRCAKLTRVGNTLYALGGFGGSLLDTVESAPILEDGNLGQWTIETNTMTVPRYVNAIKKTDQAIYVLGGHKETEGVGIKDVEIATFKTDNRLNEWQVSQPLQSGRYALSAALNNNTLYALGGLNGAIYSDVIEMTTIKPNGELNPWRYTTKLSSPRANFGTVIDHNRLYIIGGTNRDGYYRSVEVATFNDQGDIGYEATDAEMLAHQQRLNQKPIKKNLPNQGSVLSVIQTTAYSYIQVSDKGKNQWLAAPKMEITVGEHIRYSRGLTMTNFHSRSLNRDFSSIIFVETVEK